MSIEARSPVDEIVETELHRRDYAEHEKSWSAEQNTVWNFEATKTLLRDPQFFKQIQDAQHQSNQNDSPEGLQNPLSEYGFLVFKKPQEPANTTYTLGPILDARDVKDEALEGSAPVAAIVLTHSQRQTRMTPGNASGRYFEHTYEELELLGDSALVVPDTTLVLSRKLGSVVELLFTRFADYNSLTDFDVDEFQGKLRSFHLADSDTWHVYQSAGLRNKTAQFRNGVQQTLGIVEAHRLAAILSQGYAGVELMGGVIKDIIKRK